MAKVCPECKLRKPNDEFRTDKKTGKPTTYCLRCAKKRSKAWREANPANSSKWRAENPEKWRKQYAKWAYGLSIDDYQSLIQECAICGTTENLVIDHNHATGEVRGMLCRLHNTGIGMFKDDPEMLRRAAEYLLGMLVTRTADAIRSVLDVK